MDARQLETVVQFAKFLEVLSKPEELKKLVDESSKILEEQRTLLGIYDSKQKADQYLFDAEKTLAAAKEKIQADEEAHQVRMKQIEVEQNKISSDLYQSLEEARKKEQEIKEKETLTNSFLKQAKEKFERVIDESRQIEKRIVELEKKEQDLQEKSNKLKQLLG